MIAELPPEIGQAAAVVAAQAEGYRFKNTENADKKLAQLAEQRAGALHWHWLWGAETNYQPASKAVCIVCKPGGLAEYAQNVAVAFHEANDLATVLAGV